MPLNCVYGYSSFGALNVLPPRISVIPSSTSTVEGYGVNFTAYTQNLPSSSTYYWTITSVKGIVNSADFNNVDTWGSFQDIDNIGIINDLIITLGHQTGTNKSFIFNVKTDSTTSRTIATSTVITIVSPIYSSLAVSSTLMYEGEGTSTFTLTTSGCVDGTTLYYTARATSGTITANSFKEGLTAGSFEILNNQGSFSLSSALEDGNSTDDTYVVDIRTDGITGPVVKTSPAVKMVDLTTWNSSLSNKFGGTTISYTVASSVAAQTAGQNTTVTYKGTTITGNGGGRALTGNSSGNGGSFSGGDGGVVGGNGTFGTTWASNPQYTSGSGGGAGGPGNAPGGTVQQVAGGWWAGASGSYSYNFTTVAARDNASSGFWSFLKNTNFYTTSSLGTLGPGSSQGVNANFLGGGGGAFNSTYYLAANMTAYRYAPGGNGGIGGGGGGAMVGVTTNYLTQYTFYSQTGGTGGGGFVAIQYNNTWTGRIATVTGSVTVPNGTDQIKVWALGGGGGGGNTAGTTSGTAGAGGGGGGMAWKTWTWGPSYYPAKPALA